MKSKFMKGMNLQEQKKCGILVTVIGFVMFAIGFLLGDAHMGDFYSGLGCGLFACGAVRLLRVHRLSRDPEKAADYDAMLKDERTVYVANKARSMPFFICVYAQLAACLLYTSWKSPSASSSARETGTTRTAFRARNTSRV